VPNYVPLVVHVVACSLIVSCVCAIMSKRLYLVKEQSLSRRVLVILLLCIRAVLFMSCVFWPIVFHLSAVEGRTLARVVAMSVAVSWRMVQEILGPEVPARDDLEEDEEAILAVEGVKVRSGVSWHSSGIDNVRAAPTYAAIKLSRFFWKDPSRYEPRGGGRHTVFVVSRCIPLPGEGLRTHYIHSAISAERGERSGWS